MTRHVTELRFNFNMLCFTEKKLLKDLLSICDSYYRTKQLTSCVNSLHNLLVNITYHELKPIMEIEYHNDLIFLFNPLAEDTDFSSYVNLNKRMGQNLDWHCNEGQIVDCLQQLYIDFLKVNGGQEITFLYDLLF